MLFTGRPSAINCVTSGALASHAKAHDRAKTKSRDQQRHAGKFGDEKLQCGADVIAFADAAIVNSLTESSAAKIETQDRNAERVDGFGDLKNHFVVHGAAEKRMRMADQRGERGRQWDCAASTGRLRGAPPGRKEKNFVNRGAGSSIWGANRCQ